MLKPGQKQKPWQPISHSCPSASAPSWAEGTRAPAECEVCEALEKAFAAACRSLIRNKKDSGKTCPLSDLQCILELISPGLRALASPATPAQRVAYM